MTIMFQLGHRPVSHSWLDACLLSGGFCCCRPIRTPTHVGKKNNLEQAIPLTINLAAHTRTNRWSERANEHEHKVELELASGDTQLRQQIHSNPIANATRTSRVLQRRAANITLRVTMQVFDA